MRTADSARRWRVSSIAEEALLNFVANWPRCLMLVALLVVLIGVPSGGEASNIEANVKLVDQIEQGGGNVLVASPTGIDGDEVVVDARMCELLRQSPNIVAAGSVGSPTTRRLSGVGIREATFAVTSPGALEAMWTLRGDARPLDLVVPEMYANARGLHPGSRLPVGGRLATVSGVYDSDARVPNRGTTILEIGLPARGQAVECLIETTWESRSTLIGTLLAVLSRDGTPVQVLPLRTGGVFDRSPGQEHNERWSSGAWVWGSVAGGVLVLLVNLGRRSHVGLYRSLRMRRHEVVLLLTLETVVSITVAASLVVVVLCVMAYANHLPMVALAYGVRSGALTAAGLVLTATAATGVVTAGAAANQLKE